MFSAAVGVGLGLAIGLAVDTALPQTLSHNTSIPFQTLARLAILAVILAIGASLIPTQRASRLRLLDALNA